MKCVLVLQCVYLMYTLCVLDILIREYVSFPGAAALFLHFSSQSNTATRDSLKLYRDEEGRIPTNTENLCGRFPRQRIVIIGDSVLFSFQVCRTYTAHPNH